MIYRKLIFGCIGAAALLGTAHADIVVGTTHNDDIYYLGVSNSQTYGQTFKAEDVVLNSYSFNLNNFGNADQDLGFYLGTWTGTGVGSILYTQSLFIAAGSGDTDFTMSMDLNLTAGDEYIAFVSTSEASQLSDTTISQAGSSDAYTGGEFLFLNNGTDTSQWYTGSWNSWSVPQTAFTATFSNGQSAVPAPAALLPMAFGLINLARRRNKR